MTVLLSCHASDWEEVAWYFMFLFAVILSFTIGLLFSSRKHMIEKLRKSVPYILNMQWVFGYIALYDRFLKKEMASLRELTEAHVKKMSMMFTFLWMVMGLVICTAMWLIWRDLCWTNGALPLGLYLGSVGLAALWTPVYAYLSRKNWYIPFLINLGAFGCALAATIIASIDMHHHHHIIPFAILSSLYLLVLVWAMYSEFFQPWAFSEWGANYDLYIFHTLDNSQLDRSIEDFSDI